MDTSRKQISEAKARYRNPWHKPGDPQYGPAFYETNTRPTQHAGCAIYERIKHHVWDVVREGVCVAQMAGPRGAKEAVEKLAA